MKTIIFCLLVCCLYFPLSGQTKLWDGEGSNNYWHTACNWNPDGVPSCTDTATIGTGNTVDIITGTIAHCKMINLEGTAVLNIQGTGNIEISDANTCVGAASSTSVGCTVPGSAFQHDGNYYNWYGYDCVGSTPYSGSGGSVLITNNTSFTITLTIPNFGCSEQSPAPGAYVLNSGSNVTIYANTGTGSSAPNCCMFNVAWTVNWTSSDSSSGSFTIETHNNL